MDLRPQASAPPDHFQAVFNNPQTREMLSITDGGPEGVVSGTYNYGAPADGSRGGFQWPIFADGPLEYSHDPGVVIELDDGAQVLVAEATAVWRGLSSGVNLGDGEGEDSIGVVTINCGAAVLVKPAD